MVENVTTAKQLQVGKDLRHSVPRTSHGRWTPDQSRPDTFDLIDRQNSTRIRSLVPVRWGRMLESPFSFLRGAAVVMASDLAGTPATGIVVQLCGDAHVGNFGLFASPERDLLFDLNDFDETFRGPWEWDVKRLATSAVVAARSSKLGDAAGAEAARAAVGSYRSWMQKYAQMGILDVWYAHVDAQSAVGVFGPGPQSTMIESTLTRAQASTSASALPKLTELTKQGTRRIVDHPPLVTHDEVDAHSEVLHSIFEGYASSLEDDRRLLVEKFSVVDFALKVVGVGSVGTRCFIALLMTERDESLLLQVKEADHSVLEAHVPSVAGPGVLSEGRRVVSGQRIMQAASDIFLGWASAEGVDYYVRQLRDMKGSVNLFAIGKTDFVSYLELCGWTLARAHARSGNSAAISSYLGKSEAFVDAVVEFARKYADQTERDHAQLAEAVRRGDIAVERGI